MTIKLTTANYIAEQLSVKPSTLRKYVLILEEKGYVFLKNDKNQRNYSEIDLDYLRQFKQLVDNSGGGMTLEEAAVIVAERSIANGNNRDTTRHNESATSNGVGSTGDLEAKIDKLMKHIERQDARFEQQERFQRELISRLEEQQKYIAESLEKRDQQLMTALRESQETKKLLIEAKTAADAAEGEKKESRGLFAKLFGK